MKSKTIILGLDVDSACFFFVEGNIITNMNISYSALTQINIFMHIDKWLVLENLKQITVFCNW